MGIWTRDAALKILGTNWVNERETKREGERDLYECTAHVLQYSMCSNVPVIILHSCLVIQINTNGILTFDKPLRFLEGRLFPSGTKWLRDFVIIAPYWSATDYRGNGTVYWQLHNGGTAVANQIAMDILSYTGSRRSSYIPDFALVVTWSESSAYPDDSTHGFLGVRELVLDWLAHADPIHYQKHC